MLGGQKKSQACVSGSCLPLSVSPKMSVFLPQVPASTSQRAARPSLQVITKAGFGSTGIHTCVTAFTFPGHCGAIVNGSIKRDPDLGTSEVTPHSFPKRRPHTHTCPCTSLSLRNCKLSPTVSDTQPGLLPCRYQLVPEPDGGGREEGREALGGSMLSVSGFP